MYDTVWRRLRSAALFHDAPGAVACPSCCAKSTLTRRLNWGLEHSFLLIVFADTSLSPTHLRGAKMKPRSPRRRGFSLCVLHNVSRIPSQVH